MRYLFSFAIYCSLLFASVSFAKELLVFSADWCPNCVQLKNAIEKNPALVDGFEVMVIDIDKEPYIANAYGVRKIPVLVVREPGGVLRKKVGFVNEADLKNWLRRVK